MPLLVRFIILSFCFSLFTVHAQSRLTLKLSEKVDLFTKYNEKITHIEVLSKGTVLRFRTDTKIEGYYRHILILESPDLDAYRIEELNSLKLFLPLEVISKAEKATEPNIISGFNEKKRREFVNQIMANGKGLHATTKLSLPGGTFDVFNDALKLANGTYVNLTFQEAMDIANEWGCQLPNLAQAKAIRVYAQKKGKVFTARPKSPNNTLQRYTNMAKMMNDSQMHSRAKVGKTKLINGHFKWYIDDGSNNFKFYGFYYPSSCKRTGYCQNGGNGGHGNSYIDYSQSARLICKR